MSKYNKKLVPKKQVHHKVSNTRETKKTIKWTNKYYIIINNVQRDKNPYSSTNYKEYNTKQQS